MTATGAARRTGLPGHHDGNQRHHRTQDAYVSKTIETLNDLPNVLWIVSEEAPHEINLVERPPIALVRAYERTKHHQHPIGYATLESPWTQSSTTPMRMGCPVGVGFSNDFLRERPTLLQSQHQRQRSQLLRDVERTPQKNRNYAWENLTNGKPGPVHGPVPGLLSAREPEPLSFSRNGIGPEPGPTLGQFPGQPGPPAPLFAQTEPARSSLGVRSARRGSACPNPPDRWRSYSLSSGGGALPWTCRPCRSTRCWRSSGSTRRPARP